LFLSVSSSRKGLMIEREMTVTRVTCKSYALCRQELVVLLLIKV